MRYRTLYLFYFFFILPVIISAFSVVYLQKNNSINYEEVFFDDNVHTINIKISSLDWDDILKNPLEEKYHSCDIIIDGKVFENVGIRTKGNTSLKIVSESGFSNRYSFKINFGKYNKQNSFYGLDELCLNNIFADATYLREYFSYDMFRFMNVYSPLSNFVNIFINDEPWGLYLAVESVDNSFLKRNFGFEDGTLYKPESAFYRDKSEKREIHGEDLVYIDDSFESYSSIFNNAKTEIIDSDKKRLIESLRMLDLNKNIESILDIDEQLRYWVVQNFMCNYDTYIGRSLQNFYLCEKDGCLWMIPWDLNLSFGGEIYRDVLNEGIKIDDATSKVNCSIINPVYPEFKGKRPIFEKIVENKEFNSLYIKYINKFITSYFDSGYFEEKYDNIVAKIFPYIESDETAFYTLKEVERAQSILKEFVFLRLESVKGQLNGDVIEGDFDTYVDASFLNIEEMGHQKDGYFPNKNK